MQPDLKPCPKYTQSKFTSDVLEMTHYVSFISALSWGVVVQYAHFVSWPVPGVAATILVGRAFICAVGLRLNIVVATK